MSCCGPWSAAGDRRSPSPDGLARGGRKLDTQHSAGTCSATSDPSTSQFGATCMVFRECRRVCLRVCASVPLSLHLLSRIIPAVVAETGAEYSERQQARGVRERVTSLQLSWSLRPNISPPSNILPFSSIRDVINEPPVPVRVAKATIVRDSLSQVLLRVAKRTALRVAEATESELVWIFFGASRAL